MAQVAAKSPCRGRPADARRPSGLIPRGAVASNVRIRPNPDLSDGTFAGSTVRRAINHDPAAQEGSNCPIDTPTAPISPP